MKHIALLALVALFSSNTFAQKEANTWYFGQKAGMDFNQSGTPKTLTNSGMSAFEGSSSISDTKGNILMYTNGENVYNRDHVVMSNGSGLLGDVSSSQPAMIIPRPGCNDSIYYIFTTDAIEDQGADGLRYSEVNINLDGGMGAVTANKNVALFSSSTEQVTAALHDNGEDIWVLARRWASSDFYAYLITSAGVNPTPVISSVGPVVPGGFGAGGCMKVSPDGSKLASSICCEKTVLFDFNNSTGELTNPITLDGNSWGVEFSPNSQILYTSWGQNGINQYDLNASNISSSRFLIPADVSGWSLQRAPDNKIYIAHHSIDRLSVIHQPNSLGLTCDLSNLTISLASRNSTSGLPQTFFPSNKPAFTYTSPSYCVAGENPVALITGEKGGTFAIDNGGVIDTATGEVDLITSGTGNFVVTYTTNNACMDTAFASIQITTKDDPSFLLDKTAYCQGELDPIPTIIATPNGTFTGPAGISLDASSGKIDLSESTIGGPYTITYTTPQGVCSSDTTFEMEILPEEDPSFRYSSSVFCKDDANPFPILTGTEGGTFTSLFPSGLVIDDRTGEIDLSSSILTSETFPISPYTITYETPGPNCKNVSIFQVTIDTCPALHPQISASAMSICLDSCIDFTDMSIVPHGILSWLWTFEGSTDSTSTMQHPKNVCYSSPGNYAVSLAITDSFRTKDTVFVNYVSVDSCITIDPYVDIPNVFSPNGDGQNETFSVKAIGYDLERIKIYNRWGKSIFETTLPNLGWDGKTITGQEVPEGTYFYVVHVRSPDTSEKLFKGTLTLLR